MKLLEAAQTQSSNPGNRKVQEPGCGQAENSPTCGTELYAALITALLIPACVRACSQQALPVAVLMEPQLFLLWRSTARVALNESCAALWQRVPEA